jgi:hypothetical protein
MKRLVSAILFIGFSMTVFSQNVCFEVKQIWSNDKHNAFTSLVKFNDAYYCSFREGDSHIFDSSGKAEGKVRILKSTDGENWESVALFGKDKYDLRDPKLSVTPDNRLMVIIGGSIYENKKLTGRIPQVSFSKDGKHFSKPAPVHIRDDAGNGKDWIWRVTWHNGVGYAAMYSLTAERDGFLSLLSTKDGVNFDLVTRFDITGFPNEATIRFDPAGNMSMMVRRELDDQKGYFGKSAFPYTDWTWKKMDFRLGGPDYIYLDDDLVVMGSRSHFTSIAKTVLLTGNGTEKFQEVCVLPSGGDTSYPGLMVEGDRLWVSYYSSHETPKASVYLAKIPLTMFVLKK